MKLEFLERGSSDCPLVRLFAFNMTGAARLREILRTLASGACESIDLHRASGITSIDDCHLTLHLGRRDLGFVRRGRSAFDCVFTAGRWDDIAALVDPFCESENTGYQWLTERGDASLLLSPDGSW